MSVSEHRLGVFGPGLVVAHVPARVQQPRQAPLHHPAPRQDHKSGCIGAQDPDAPADGVGVMHSLIPLLRRLVPLVRAVLLPDSTPLGKVAADRPGLSKGCVNGGYRITG